MTRREEAIISPKTRLAESAWLVNKPGDRESKSRSTWVEAAQQFIEFGHAPHFSPATV